MGAKVDLRPTSETDPRGFETRAAIALLKSALAQVPAKRQVARRSLSNVLAHLEGREIHPDCHGATLKLQVVSRHACPKIPQGYGVDPGDCACGNCPEAKGGI